MKKMVFENNKGITLVALVITIIVLLILAGVTISMIFGNNGILTKANDAKTASEKADILDGIKLEYADSEMGKYTNSGNSSESLESITRRVVNEKGARIEGETVITKSGGEFPLANIYKEFYKDGEYYQVGNKITNGTNTYEIGDKILNYDHTSGGVLPQSGYDTVAQNGWSILGSENGKIMIVADESVGDISLGNTWGYRDGVNDINSISDKYGHGTYGDGGRSLKVEDINKITGYDPSTAGYEKGQLDEYGNEVTYTQDEANENEDENAYFILVSSGSNGKSDRFEWWYASFNCPINTPVKSTAYRYSISDKGISSGTKLYNLIAKNCWLANTYISTHIDGLGHGMFYTDSSGRVWTAYFYSSEGENNEHENGIRPVVYLKSDVKLTGSSENGWTLSQE